MTHRPAIVQRAVAIACFAVIGGACPAPAQPPDYPCYVQLRSRSVVNLTPICGIPARDRQEMAKLNDYLAAIRALAPGDQRLLDLVNRQPGLLLAAAQEYCAARASGVSRQQFLESKYAAILEVPVAQREALQTGMQASSLAAGLAANVYCPGL
jgi:hypothetical protein